MKTLNATLVSVLFCLAAFQTTRAQDSTNAADRLKHYMAVMQKSEMWLEWARLLTSENQAARENIITLAATMNPKPSISDDAQRHFVKAATFMKEATAKSDYQLAVKEYRQVLVQAPWWGPAYFNEGVALQSAGQYDAATADFKLYLLTNPDDAAAVKTRLYSIEAEKELAAKQEQAFVGKWHYGIMGTIGIAGPLSVHISDDFGATRSGNGIEVTGISKVSIFQIQGRKLKFGVSTDETWYSNGRVIDRRHHDRDFDLEISDSGKKLSGTCRWQSSAGNTTFPVRTEDCEFTRRD